MLFIIVCIYYLTIYCSNIGLMSYEYNGFCSNDFTYLKPAGTMFFFLIIKVKIAVGKEDIGSTFFIKNNS